MESGGGDITFMFQIGLIRDVVTTDSSELTLRTIKELACDFINKKFSDHGLTKLNERIILFRHDYNSENILQHINAASEITNETLVEIVVTGRNISSSSESGPDEVQIRPHVLLVHSYKAPTFCDFCGEMLFGLVKQGLKCDGCGLNFHKRCVSKIPNNCRRSKASHLTPLLNSPFSSQSSLNSLLSLSLEDSTALISSSTDKNNRLSVGGSSRSVTGANVQNNVHIPHSFMTHTYTKPTVCSYCKKLLRGLFRQGVQCKDCKLNVHKGCLSRIRADCSGEPPKEPGNESGDTETGDEDSEAEDSFNEMLELAQGQFAAPGGGSGLELTNGGYPNQTMTTIIEGCDDETGKVAVKSPTASNIPLQRIVQSVKHSKRRGSKVLKEGWMVHCTNKDSLVKRHFWRLDTKSITMFQNETGNRYYKEIPLSEILEVITDPPDNSVYCFELRTGTVHYFVGQKTCEGDAGGTVETGIGLQLAKGWEGSIRHALNPVPSELVSPSDDSSGSSKKLDSQHSHDPSVDIFQQYQIFTDEVLGSGQFGTVYGGVHRTSGRSVAIKMIDKLRFPTKQEAQLKNEVAILQNLSHPGVVNLERMFETPAKIFVVMEKLKGDMLDMILNSEKRSLPERCTKFLVTQILVALKHLHCKNIVHCDLKPENVLLSSDSDFPQVKLCDFGFARIIGEKSFRRSMVGTPAYLAPEVLRNKGYNRSLDMWSVGVIVYVSLSGTFPFHEDEDINDQIQNAAFMYPPNPWKEISSEAIDIINNLLQVKQRKRYTVDKTLSHVWLQDYQLWCDLRDLERLVGIRYLTHESDDARWEAYRKEHGLEVPSHMLPESFG